MEKKSLGAYLLLLVLAFGCKQANTRESAPFNGQSNGSQQTALAAPAKTLVGKWSVMTPDGSGTLEFLDGGTLSITGRNNQAKDEITMQAKWVAIGGTESHPSEMEIEYVSGRSNPGQPDPKGEKVRMKLEWLNDNEVAMTPTYTIGSDGVVVETQGEDTQVLKRIHDQ